MSGEDSAVSHQLRERGGVLVCPHSLKEPSPSNPGFRCNRFVWRRRWVRRTAVTVAWRFRQKEREQAKREEEKVDPDLRYGSCPSTSTTHLSMVHISPSSLPVLGRCLALPERMGKLPVERAHPQDRYVPPVPCLELFRRALSPCRSQN
ncbi:hypothetical protein NMY22_g11887 [Coprinellus aureogranulatus]|nr:hypothetical protein NMY22_g11887 [Coprinellus aureogranulatus]